MSKCVIIGEQSLLIQCATNLLEHGHSILLVVAESAQITQWCRDRGLPCIASIRAITESLDGEQFDYLFSLTNLKMMSTELLELPREMAINFHDGPLPAYAGLNAPVWALLNGEFEHGVTFHQMTASADKGDILVQKTFSIDQDESVFTLNAKCYEAGLQAFIELLSQIDQHSFNPVKQDLTKRQYFSASRRPDRAGCIDWNQSADEIERLLRALNYGQYLNPLTLPKIWLQENSFVVREVARATTTHLVEPGTLLAMDADSITVQAADAALIFHGVCDFSGRGISPTDYLARAGIEEGELLPSMSNTQVSELNHLVESFGEDESFWRRRLEIAEPVAAPFATVGVSTAKTREWSHAQWSLTDVCDAEFLLASIALLFARLADKSNYTLAFQPVGCRSTAKSMQCMFERWLPLPVSVDPQQTFAIYLEACANEIAQTESRAGFCADMYARDPALRGVKSCASYPIKLRRLSDDAVASPELPCGQNALLIDIPDHADKLDVYFDANFISCEQVIKIGKLFKHLLTQLGEAADRPVGIYSLVDSDDAQLLAQWNQTKVDTGRTQCLHQIIEQQVAKAPDTIACHFQAEAITYRELNSRANQLANYLVAKGVVPGDLVGILLNRSIEMLVALIAVHKAGGAYVPLDPVYPKARLRYMVEDSQLRYLLAETDVQHLLGASSAELILLDQSAEQVSSNSIENVDLPLDSSSLAYVIYTSGSTGKPKGVMVEHRNVVNFFTGMDQRLEPGPGTWLAVTSISFDISVLELFWTLARGFTIVLYADAIRQKKIVLPSTPKAKAVQGSNGLEFGLFYWNVATDESEYDNNKYQLLIEGAKYADINNFNAVWTPERHFASFGGLFPNPSVTSAALATITNNVSLRAGSCVVPLHSPIRVAEEWSVVDNLSNGRVGISIAAGWAPPDFAIKPENFAESKKIMFEAAETVQKLWSGETVTFPGPNGDVPVRTLPRPLQPKLPLWITTAGNVDSFIQAGRMGANVLTHLLGQTIEQVAEKVAAYREAWRAAGHSGHGLITVMLHTFLGPDQQQVEELVREPMKNYLKSAMFLVKSAAWQFPTFKQMSDEQGKSLDEFFETISDQDMDDLLEFAFQRYFRTSGLFGTPEHCQKMVASVLSADCDEIACLIDFGVETDLVLEHLPYLNQLREHVQGSSTNKAQLEGTQAARIEEKDYLIPALLQRHNITHFQCTPSMATMLAADDAVRPKLAQLQHMMIGGEALPPGLASDLFGLVAGRVTNMYGPTETTIWSAIGDVGEPTASSVSIGRPLANQQIHVLDKNQQPVPPGIAGELVIGGEGVVRGYLNRPTLTAERFLSDSNTGRGSRPMYRTGDLGRYRSDGRLECLGRVDSQVKIRGYRVELGEIEALLQQDPAVAEVAVVLREDVPGDERLVAYVRAVNEAEFNEKIVREGLAEHLPSFMLPSHFVLLRSLPLTPNGKIDRNALPKPVFRKSVASQKINTPVNELESLIVGIWRRALNIDEIDTSENFFDLGGHSLLVIQVLKELRDKIGENIHMTDLFRYTTVADLAGFLSAGKAQSSRSGSARAQARKARRARRSN